MSKNPESLEFTFTKPGKARKLLCMILDNNGVTHLALQRPIISENSMLFRVHHDSNPIALIQIYSNFLRDCEYEGIKCKTALPKIY